MGGGGDEHYKALQVGGGCQVFWKKALSKALITYWSGLGNRASVGLWLGLRSDCRVRVGFRVVVNARKGKLGLGRNAHMYNFAITISVLAIITIIIIPLA